ncbi:MAG: hypothetical protein ACYSWP_02160 [Planctomycetota bacterium]|jgi:hypothetical protein
MSNRIDFFQPVEGQLALAAARVSVEVDGSLCPYLEPIEIVFGGRPEFGRAKLGYNPAAFDGPVMSVEQIEEELGMGRSVCIRQVYNMGAPGSVADGFPIFSGYIEGMEKKIDSQGERLEIFVRDISAHLERISVYGQRVSNGDGTSVFLVGSGTIFNEDGSGNAATAQIEHNGYSYKVFGIESEGTVHWSCAEAVYYLLCEYLAAGRLQLPSVEQLDALFEGQAIRNLDVTGLNLVEALYRCCKGTGVEFKFVPRSSMTGPGEAIVFYKCGIGRAVELNLQQAGEQFSISKTDIGRLHSRKSFWPVTHKFIGLGDYKVYEATFDLVKAWDPADEDTDFEKFSPLTNSEFYKVKDVYRKWCLNEAGSYSGTPYNQGAAYDLSKIFETADYVQRRREFFPMLSTDKQGHSLGYHLGVSFDGGDNWWQYLYAINNLQDECGVWLSSDRLDVDTWIAALKGVLKFRITASVVSDERLSCEYADGPIGSCVPVFEHVMSMAGKYKYRRVTGRSIFFNVTDGSLGVADEVDDSTALYEYVRKKAEGSSEIIETSNVQTPCVAFGYKIGDRVTTSPESRDLLGCRGEDRSVVWIKRVKMDFRQQCTNLEIVRTRRG